MNSPKSPYLGHSALIVDDEEIVLVALRETLRQLGFKVTAVPDAIEGLTRLQDQPFSIVITDHQMPRVTGLEFLAQVRQIQPRASRVLITAVLSLGTVIDAINRAEICRFLLKPWQREDLLATLDAAVARFESIDRLHREADRLQAENNTLREQLRALSPAIEPAPPTGHSRATINLLESVAPRFPQGPASS